MIVFLAKVFSEAQHADDFIKGSLYANTLCYFRNIERDSARGDSEEGAIIPPLEGLGIELTSTNPTTGEFDKITIAKDDLAAPPIIRPRWFEHINLFCMYAARTGQFTTISEQNIADFQKQLEMPEDCQEFGDHAVVIKNTSEFIRRVNLAAEKKGYRVYYGPVEYYDPDIGTPPIHSPIQTLFLKRKIYEYQKEWRLAIDTSTAADCPIIFDIGGIEDITAKMSTPDLISFQSFDIACT